MNEKIKAFEEQLRGAINAYLQNKKFLQNGKGTKYYCAKPATHDLVLHFSSQDEEELLVTFLNCPTNTQPSLSGYIDLTLKNEGGTRYSKTCYYFHIYTSDYKVFPANPYEIIVHNITRLYKQDSRLY